MKYIHYNASANKGTIHSGFISLINILQRIILENDVNVFVEIGCAAGQITFPLAETLYNKNNNSKLFAYDWWNISNDGTHAFNQTDFESNLFEQPKELQNIITYKCINYFDWLKNPVPEHWDVLYLDINNDGDKVKRIYNLYKEDIDNKKRFVFFEGGSDGRFIKPMYKDKIKFSEMNIPFITLTSSDSNKELSLLGNF